MPVTQTEYNLLFMGLFIPQWGFNGLLHLAHAQLTYFHWTFLHFLCLFSRIGQRDNRVLGLQFWAANLETYADRGPSDNDSQVRRLEMIKRAEVMWRLSAYRLFRSSYIWIENHCLSCIACNLCLWNFKELIGTDLFRLIYMPRYSYTTVRLM